MAGLPDRNFTFDPKEGKNVERYPTFFGYEAWCIETAVRDDDVEMLKACESAGYLNKEVEAICCTMIKYAKDKKAKEVVKYLEKNGYR